MILIKCFDFSIVERIKIPAKKEKFNDGWRTKKNPKEDINVKNEDIVKPIQLNSEELIIKVNIVLLH